MGMGKAFTAVADDASAAYWNPAGLTRLVANEVTAMHVTLFEDTMYDFVGYAHSFPKIGSFGLAVVRVGSTGFEGRAEDGYDMGSFDISDLGVLFSYGYPLSQRVSIGGTAKLVRQKVGSYSASGGGVDVGMMYYAHKVLTFGLSVKNFLAPSIMLREQSDKFPLTARLGIACRLFQGRLQAALDINRSRDQDFKFCVGAEGWIHRMIALRAGIDETEITGGVGFLISDFRLDYAFATQTLGISHRVALTFMFGGLGAKMRLVPEVFSPMGRQKVVVMEINVSADYPLETWKVGIKDGRGILVRTWAGREMPPAQIVWDGKDQANRTVGAGKYSCEIEVTDELGRHSSYRRIVKVVSPSKEMYIPRFRLE